MRATRYALEKTGSVAMLDRTRHPNDAMTSPADSGAWKAAVRGGSAARWLRRTAVFFALSFSSLTRRIVSLNPPLDRAGASILIFPVSAGLIDRAENCCRPSEVMRSRSRDRHPEMHALHHRPGPAARSETPGS